MQEFVRCKACGFIIEKGKQGEHCPACGLPKTVFEPYKMLISPKRRRLLGFHIHPVILHFPQAFVFLGLFLMTAIPFLSDPLKSILEDTSKVIITLLPVTVLGGFVSGIFDGKVRFKKIQTPILRKKMGLGTSFLVLSILSAVLIYQPQTATLILVEIICLALASGLATILGLMGASLIESKLPG